MNCGRSSSVEWKLPKLQRRVRFPSPAPPPPGRAPGGFVMPVRGGIALHEGPTRRRHAVRRLRVVQTPHHCGHEGRTPPTRPGAMSVGAKKLAQHDPSSGSSAKKLAQRDQKGRNWAVLSPQGELFRAFALIQRRRANFFAHGTTTTQNLNIQGHDDALTLST